VITDSIVTAAKSFQSLSTVEWLERVLVYFNRFSLGHRIQISSKREFMPDKREAPHARRPCECESKEELSALIDFMVEMGWLSVPQGSLQTRWIAVTVQGWLKIDELIKKFPSSTQTFVAMWFNVSMTAAFAEGIEPAIRDCDYQAVRIDKKDRNYRGDTALKVSCRRPHL
jgi:hypothetical protein